MHRKEQPMTTLTPTCLQWARERANLTIDALAEKLKVSTDNVLAWESTGEIKTSAIDKLAHATHTPVGYLFLSEPPEEVLPISDFRTVGGKQLKRPSVNLLDIIYDAQRRQNWYREYSITNDDSTYEYVGSIALSNDIVQSANKIKTFVKWDTESRNQCKDSDEALKFLINTLEDIGILVMRNGVVGNNTRRVLDVEEFRGFALADKYAPLIFINGLDSKAAQMFTLIHELVHIWMGISGVSNLNQTYSLNNKAEMFCNSIAAEFLVPTDELKNEWENICEYRDRIYRLKKHFKVSTLVILRRLRDAYYITNDEFNSLYNQELNSYSTFAKGPGGGNFYNTLRSRLGDRFISALIESTYEGNVSYRDAFQLLGVSNPKILHNLAQNIGVVG